MDLLHRLLSGRGFTLPQFELVPFEFGSDEGESAGELLLDNIAVAIGAGAEILPPRRPAPTAGVLQASIERHLRGCPDSPPPLSPADELRSALAELRQSLA